MVSIAGHRSAKMSVSNWPNIWKLLRMYFSSGGIIQFEGEGGTGSIQSETRPRSSDSPETSWSVVVFLGLVGEAPRNTSDICRTIVGRGFW